MSPTPQWRLKRIYDPSNAGDGTRVLVDRLWPRGLSKQDAGIDLWLKSIAPSTDLRHWFNHQPERWMEFTQRYRKELAENTEAVAQLEKLSAGGPVTLLYAARDTEHNQAQVLLSYLQDKPSDD
ncbi:MAG: hypothetical protein ABS76_27785 [Pelagibacterium sp. SCN 64-44]|mgnify:FL=1|nr:MAG: hypothetical protein ABS76_27785 [Pelagibacterium sp. SCN 64-44]